MEVVELLFAAPRQRSAVTVVRIVTVVDMAVELGGAMEPVAGSDKHPAINQSGP